MTVPSGPHQLRTGLPGPQRVASRAVRRAAQL